MSVVNMLYGWQHKLIEKFAKRSEFGYFLDMGLGKTPIAIASAEYTRSTKVLVISINSKAIESAKIKGSWLWWAEHSTIGYTLYNKKVKPEEFKSDSNDILLINYEALFDRSVRRGIELSKTIKAFIKSAKGHRVTLILDESHRVKNLSSKTTKAVNQIKRQLKIHSHRLHTYLLSGTPFTQGYIDLYSQLKLLGYNETKGTFIDKFCIRGRVPGLLEWQQPIVGYKNIQLLYRTLHKYSITIKSDEVEDLPEQIFIDHELPIGIDFKFLTLEKVKQNYLLKYLEKRDLLDEYNLEHRKNILVNNPFHRNLSFPKHDWFAETSGVSWIRARQASIGFQGSAENHKWFDKSRLKSLKKLIKENPENYVCFYNYTPELFELFDVFEKEGYLIDVYSGEIKSLYHYEQFEEMTEDEKVNAQKRVIIANYASGSTGKNWQDYNHVIEFSVPLFGHHSQAIKRVHRIGQNEIVFYHRFYQDNFLDRGMLNALNEQIEYDTKMFEADRKVQEMEFTT